jgi:hypothetical protein
LEYHYINLYDILVDLVVIKRILIAYVWYFILT